MARVRRDPNHKVEHKLPSTAMHIGKYKDKWNQYTVRQHSEMHRNAYPTCGPVFMLYRNGHGAVHSQRNVFARSLRRMQRSMRVSAVDSLLAMRAEMI